MVTIDLNTEQRWNELFQRVESGEIVQVMRGDREIALIQPSELLAEDEAYLNHLAELGLKHLGELSSDDDFADWNQPNGTR